MVGGRPVGQDLAFQDEVALLYERLLIDTGILVGALKLDQLVDVHAVADVYAVGGPYDNSCGVDVFDNALAPGNDRDAGVLGDYAFDTRPNERGTRLDKRHGLALHV